MAPVSRRGTAPGNWRPWSEGTPFAVPPGGAGQRPRRGRRLVRVSTPSDQEPAPGSAAPPPFRERRVNDIDRRDLTLRTFLTSGFSPRRRAGRRAGGQESPVDFHEPYLLVLAVVMLLLSVADAFLTVTLMSDGAQETNPLLAFVLDEHPRFFAVTKMALTGMGVVLLVAIARTKLFRVVRAELFFQALVVAYVALVAYEAWLVSMRF